MKTVQLTNHNHDEAAAEAVEILQGGGVVLLPTDTAYGLAAAADSDKGVEYVLELKGRGAERPLSVMVADRPDAEQLAEFSQAASKLWAAFMPGPLTMVLPVKPGTKLNRAVVKDGAVGIRQPDYPLCTAIGERFGKPFTATSANRSGQPPAYEPEEFLNTLPGDAAPHLVIDGGRLPMVPVSTVVKISDSVDVLREGAISKADIMKAVNS